MSDFKVTYKTRNINSKRLFNEFKSTIEDVCDEYISHQATMLDRTYNYDAFAAFLNMYMDDLIDKKVITQYDVIADHRVNDALDVRSGKINAVIKFRQMNCLNVSEIHVHIEV